VQLAAASRLLASRYVQRVAPSLARSCTVAHDRLASPLQRRVLGCSSLRRGLWPSSCVKSVALSSAQKLNVGPQPPRVTPPRSVEPCGARRCVAAFGRAAACIASRLVQLEAARRPTAAPRLSTSERRALRSSPLRRGTWPSRYLQSVAPNLAQSCTSAHRSLASLHLGASRVAQLAAALRPLAVQMRAERRAWFSSKLHSGPQAPRVTPPRSVAYGPARRCAAGLGRPAAGMA